MTNDEIRAAAASACVYVGQERIDYIKGSYPETDWERISKMCDWLDDIANNQYEERAFEPCIYNMGMHYEC